jgi:hypothetical protein
VHEGNLCSGVFYAQLPPTASPLYLSDPRGMPRHHEDFPIAGSTEGWQTERLGHFLPGEATVPPFTGEVAVMPQPGDMVLFPSWLPHHVQPPSSPPGAAPADLADEQPRVSFAFNLEALSAMSAWGQTV